MRTTDYKLISHHLCPFVQRAAIALSESDIAFERINIDLADKPAWFKAVSPLGKVPLLLSDDDILFESSVIAEYVNDIGGAGLLASDALERAKQKGWMEFASAVIANIGQLYNAEDDAAYRNALSTLHEKWAVLERTLTSGPWFAGERFSLVDAAFAPAFRYLDVIETLVDDDLLANNESVKRWRHQLQNRASVQNAVSRDYPQRLLVFLAKRNSCLGRRAATLLDAEGLDAA